MACGDRELRASVSGRLIRLYWNLSAEGAARFVHETTSVFNAAGLPFRLKVLNDPGRFTRCDAAVVYLYKSDFPGAARQVKRVYTDVDGYLKPLTPVFTRTLAPGLGFAEDPGEGESFGEHRCRLLADGMVRAHEDGAASLEERLEVAVKRFTEGGISLSEPYLSPGSTYVGFEMSS
jgi:class II lanthipeptide synthase